VPTLFFTAVITDRKQKQEKMKKKRKNPRKLSPFERAATLDLQQLGNNETNKLITLYLSTRNQLAAKFDRSVGRFGMEKRKGERFAMRDS
jgi:DNA repair protein RadC